MSSNPKPSLVRLDTNLATHIDDFSQFGEDSDLMKSVLIYAALKVQNTLLKDSGTLEVSEVSEKLGYGRGRLAAPHKSAAHILRLQHSYKKDQQALSEYIQRGKTDIEQRVYSSVFENALFRLNTEAMRITGGYKHYVQDGVEMKQEIAETFQFFTSIKAREVKTQSGQTKIVYDYTLSEKFIRNFSLLYKYLDFERYVALRKCKLEDLYIFLTNLRDILLSQNTNTTNTVSLEKLLRLASVNYNRTSDAQTNAQATQWIRDAKRALNEKFATLVQLSDLNVTLSWTKKSDHKQYYTPRLTFGEKVEILPDPIDERNKTLQLIFCKLVVDHLQKTETTYLISGENAEQCILTYLKSPQRDKQVLSAIYLQAYLDTYKTVERIQPGFIESVLSSLEFCEKLDDIGLALRNYNPRNRKIGIK